MEQKNKAEEVKSRLHFKHKHCVDPQWPSGGLCLMRNQSLEIHVVDACKNYIHTLCRNKGDGSDWDCTLVYGIPDLLKEDFYRRN